MGRPQAMPASLLAAAVALHRWRRRLRGRKWTGLGGKCSPERGEDEKGGEKAGGVSTAANLGETFHGGRRETVKLATVQGVLGLNRLSSSTKKTSAELLDILQRRLEHGGCAGHVVALR